MVKVSGRLLAVCGSLSLAVVGAVVAFPVERALESYFGSGSQSAEPSSRSGRSLDFTSVNPITGTGCDTQCLPQLSDAKDSTLTFYSQAFGIKNISGTIKYKDGATEKLETEYMAGNYSHPELEIQPSNFNGEQLSIVKVCFVGEDERNDVPISWESSYKSEYVNEYVGYRFSRVAPMTVGYGKDKARCG